MSKMYDRKTFKMSITHLDVHKKRGEKIEDYVIQVKKNKKRRNKINLPNQKGQNHNHLLFIASSTFKYSLMITF